MTLEQHNAETVIRMGKEIEKLKAKLCELKEDNGFLRRQEKNINARIERLLRNVIKDQKAR